MTSDTRSPAEIERDIERERAGLKDSLDDLQDRFSVEGIARQFSDQFREHGGELGRSVTDAVKRNPMALALTGVGLAWLMLGDRSSGGSSQGRIEHDRAYRSNRRDQREFSDYDHTRLSHPGPSSHGELHDRFSRGDTPAWAIDADDFDGGTSLADKARGAAGDAAGAVSGAASSAADSVSGAASSVADNTRKAGSSVAGTARSAADAVAGAGKSAADSARNAAAAASDRAAALRRRLAQGTEDLSEEARARVIAARERAVEARDAAMEYTRQGREKAVDFYEEQPLVAGALAVAVGAAIGAALPRSRAEDRYMGETSDQLMAEAERIYAHEKRKVQSVAKAATDEARQIAREAKADADDAAPADTAAKAVVDTAKSSGQRIADAARDEAKKQNLGDVKPS